MRNNHLPDLLKNCRKDAGLSQEELAEKLCVERTYISKIENGHYPSLSYEFVKKWGQATNRVELISMDLTGEGNEEWKHVMAYRNLISSIKTNIENFEMSV